MNSDNLATFGFNAAHHATRVTVHSGNHFPKLAVFTSMQSWGVPFQCEHHVTGHRHSCPKSKWYVEHLHSRRRNSRSVCHRVISETGATVAAGHTFPPSRLPDRSRWSYLVASRHGNPGALLRRPVRALGHCSGPYWAALEPVWPTGQHSNRYNTLRPSTSRTTEVSNLTTPGDSQVHV